MRIIGAILLCIGAIEILSSIYGLFSGSFIYSLVRIFFGCILFYLGLRPFKYAAKQKRDAISLQELPEMQTSDYKYSIGTSAIALNKTNRTLFLADGQKRKIYSLDDVRRWSYELRSGGEIHGFNAISVIAFFSENQRIKKENQDASGLFLEVRDIENPKWQIKFKGNKKTIETELLRWMEILTQNIKEA